MNINRKHPNLVIGYFSKPAGQRLLIVMITVLVSGAFLIIGYLNAEPGFPLDDSWIHLTYARNLVVDQKWEFNLGELSAGSTSPLWTMLLSIGYLLGFEKPYLWTSILSIVLLVACAITLYEIINKKHPINGFQSCLGSLLFALDWHLLWSAASGMETLLFCFLSLMIAYLLIDDRNWLCIGVLCGLCIWTRPDGVTFLGPVLVMLFWKLAKKKLHFIELLKFFVPLALLIGLYGWFNYSLSGTVFPNTYYSKQIEYASALNQPIWTRLFQIFLVPVSSASIFLLPGFINSIKNAVQKKEIWRGVWLAWFFGHGFLYAIRLPMVYQHGRYLFPLIPIFFILGISGTIELIKHITRSKPAYQKLIRIVAVCTVGCALIFAGVGESAFIVDLKVIKRFMIEPALWIKDNTEENAIVAAHDIGAMGYFGERKIIDLAGLVQPEISSIIRNEEQIRDYLINKKADYLMIFSDWYQTLGSFGNTVQVFEMPEGGYSDKVIINDLSKVH